MASNIEVDLMLKRAIRLLHSSGSNSATELRQMLDEVIKQRCGAEKMMCKTLSKTHLEEEKTFPGRMVTPPPQQTPQEEEFINLTNSPTKSESPDTIMDSDEGNASSSGPVISNTSQIILSSADEDVNLKEFGDLNCYVCGEMMFTATNRLIECSNCGALYHQDCHKPPISNEEATEDREHLWQCAVCCDKSNSNKSPTNSSAEIVVIPDDIVTSITTSAKTIKSTSSSSSNSSSPFYKPEHTTSKQHHRGASSTSSREEQRSSKSSATASSSSTSVNIPTINIISASERTAASSKRSSHSSSSKSSRSRHSDSSSSSRRKSTK